MGRKAISSAKFSFYFYFSDNAFGGIRSWIGHDYASFVGNAYLIQ